MKKFFKNNRAGDVGILGMLIVCVMSTCVVLGLDMYANMISKSYVINKMQAAQSYALMSSYDHLLSNEQKLYMDPEAARKSYLTQISSYLKVSDTVFETLQFSSPVLSQSNDYRNYTISGYVTYTPHRFIANPQDVLFGGAEVRSDKVNTKVATIISVYSTT